MFDIFDIFNIDNMLGGGEGVPSNCILLTQNPTVADVFGYSSDLLNAGTDAYGTMIPDTTADGTLIYSYEINHVTGDFIMKFGNDAVAQISNVTQIIINHFTDDVEGNILFAWDDINLYYVATDLEKATALKTHLDTTVCLEASAVPTQLILYNYETLEVLA